MNTNLQSEFETTKQDYKGSRSVSYAVFTENLVGYVFSLCNPSFQMPPTIDIGFRKYHNPFDDGVRNAVNCVLFYPHRKKRYSFKHLTETDESIHAKYLKCDKRLQDSYFSIGFNVTDFLYYCVDIAVMSIAFLNSGMKEAPKVAIVCILNTLECYNHQKIFAAMDSVVKAFPYVSKNSRNKAIRRLKEDLQFFISPLKELSKPGLSSESSGISSGVEIRFATE